jgi:hypothetical protein
MTIMNSKLFLSIYITSILIIPYYSSKLRSELNHCIDHILSYLVNVVKQSKNTKTQQLALSCLQKWIGYEIPVTYIYHTATTTTTTNNSIVDLGLFCLSNIDLFEESTNLLSEIFANYSFSSSPSSSDSITLYRAYTHRIVQTIASLYEQALKNGLDDVCKQLIKLIVTYGESNSVFVTQGHAESIRMIQFIIMTCRSSSYEHIQCTLEFWSALQTQLSNTLYYSSSSDTNNNSTTDVVNAFNKIFTDLLPILISHLRIPSEEDAEDDEEFIQFRRESADVLQCVYNVLYGDYLNICLNGIKQGMAHNKWQLIEASLFAVAKVHEYVKESHFSHLIPIIQLFNDLTVLSDKHVPLKVMQIQILGEYAHYCGKQNDEFVSYSLVYTLTTVYRMIASSTNQKQNEHQKQHLKEAVDAFYSLCEKSNKNPVLANQMISIYIQQQQQQLPQQHQQVQIRIVEGLSYLVRSVEDADRQLQLLSSVLQPVLNLLNQHYTTTVATKQQQSISHHQQQAIIHSLYLFRALMHAYSGDEEYKIIIKLIQHVWKLLCDCMMLFKHDSAILDAFCRLFECLVCSVGVHVETLEFMNNLSLMFYDLYRQILNPSILRVIKMVTYGLDSTTSVYQSLLKNYIGLCQVTFDSNSFHNDDQLMIEFFTLQHSILKSYPQLFFANIEVCECIVDHAITCIEYRNMEVSSSIVKFIVSILDFNVTKSPQYQQQVIHMLQYTSPELIPKVLKAVLFEDHPASRELIKILHAYRFYKRFLTTFTDNLIRYDQTIQVLQRVKQEERNAFASQLAKCTTLSKMKTVIEEFKSQFNL